MVLKNIISDVMFVLHVVALDWVDLTNVTSGIFISSVIGSILNCTTRRYKIFWRSKGGSNEPLKPHLPIYEPGGYIIFSHTSTETRDV